MLDPMDKRKQIIIAAILTLVILAAAVFCYVFISKTNHKTPSRGSLVDSRGDLWVARDIIRIPKN